MVPAVPGTQSQRELLLAQAWGMAAHGLQVLLLESDGLAATPRQQQIHQVLLLVAQRAVSSSRALGLLLGTELTVSRVGIRHVQSKVSRPYQAAVQAPRNP